MTYGGPCASAKVAGICWLLVCEFFFPFSSSYWRNKHKQSAWDTMSTYINESDLSGDETFDDIGNFDIVNSFREEINNRERQFGTLAGSSDEWAKVERAKHSFLLCLILLSCLVMNKICLKFKPSDEWFKFWGIRTGRCSRFCNLGYFYLCINNLCFKFI